MQLHTYTQLAFLLLSSLQLCAGPIYINKTGFDLQLSVYGPNVSVDVPNTTIPGFNNWNVTIKPNVAYELAPRDKSNFFSVKREHLKLIADNHRNDAIEVYFDTNGKLAYKVFTKEQYEEQKPEEQKTDAEKLRAALKRIKLLEAHNKELEARVQQLEEKLKLESSTASSSSTTTTTTTGK